jgi:hypothetical protein
MAFKHGKSTAVYFNARDLSPYLNVGDFDADVDTGDTTTFQATWKTALAGQVGAKASFGGFYDPTVTDLTASIGIDFGVPVLTYCPGGAGAIGDRARMLSVATTSYAESAPVGGIVAVKWAVMASGPVGFGDILHALSEDTNTTTGATKDDAAASSTGWIAHLHVTAVDAGSWVVKLEDSADAAAWADVAGASFTALTAAGYQRLRSALSTTTLRRYVRYVATRTGGSAGDGITFVLAYARNN